MQSLIKIGQLAKMSGVSIDTIRFYEDKGLVSPKTRSDAGYRYYDNTALNKLSFVQRAKDLGFTLSEIKGFLQIQISKKGQCSLAQTRVDEKLESIDKKISDLKNMKKALKKISIRCAEGGASGACHFLELLGGGSNAG